MADKAITDSQLQPQLVPGLLVGVGWDQPFIGELALPPVPVPAQDFYYETWDNSGLVDEGPTKRGLHTGSKILTPPKNSTIRGFADEYSSKMPLDVNVLRAAAAIDRANPPAAGRLSHADRRRQVNMAKLVFNEKIQREKEAAALIFDSTKYDSGLQTTSLSFKTCKISDIKDAVRDVQIRTGFGPDTLVLGHLARTSFDDNANFLDRINGGATATDPAVVTDQLIASLLGIKRLLIGLPVVQPKALPGAIAASATPLWTEDSAALIYSGDLQFADEATPSFGKVFYVNFDGTGLRYGAWSWVDDEPNTVEWQKIAEYRLVAQTMQSGYFFGNADQ